MTGEVQAPFRDRTDGGKLLGAALLATHDWPDGTLVLALPRGGVPVGCEVAAALGAPLDVEVVRKLGVPWQPELAMGAIAAGYVYLDQTLIDHLRVSREEIDRVVKRESAEVVRRERLYRGNRPAPRISGRSVILADDGLATGASMLAALHHVMGQEPSVVTVAVPVGSSEACAQIRALGADCVCVITPVPLTAIGLWYLDFTQFTDDEVMNMLRKAQVRFPARVTPLISPT